MIGQVANLREDQGYTPGRHGLLAIGTAKARWFSRPPQCLTVLTLLNHGSNNDVRNSDEGSYLKLVMHHLAHVGRDDPHALARL
jgi:hypothetical protein